MDNSGITIAAKVDCELSENPLWHDEKRCVYWTDIPAGKVYSFDASSRQHRIVYNGPPVGGFTIQHDGSLLLFRVNDIARLDSDGRVTSLRQFSEAGMDRFNDVTADPEGRVYAGTIGKHPNCGLYRVDLDGTITKLFSGTGCSNGMGFSPDLETFFWTNTTTRQIFQFDYQQKSGDLTNRRLFYEATASEGYPDGLIVDVEGCVWSARWGGSTVIRHGIDGKVLEQIRVPVSNVTSLCFGDDASGKFFVTTAKEPGEHNELAGSLFQMPAPVHGRAKFRSRINVS